MKPTSKQHRLIKHFARHGAPSPTTRAACSTLIGYLCQGQHSRLPNCSARLALFSKWTGAIVRVTRSGHPYHRRLGKVTGWRMLSQSEINDIKETRGVEPLPFLVLVKLEFVARPTAFPLSDLTIVNPAEQKLLFPLLNT